MTQIIQFEVPQTEAEVRNAEFVDRRMVELDRLRIARFGTAPMPETAETRILAEVISDHLVSVRDSRIRAHTWCAAHAPWHLDDALAKIAKGKWRLWYGQQLGDRLLLNEAERAILAIETISPARREAVRKAMGLKQVWITPDEHAVLQVYRRRTREAQRRMQRGEDANPSPHQLRSNFTG